MRCLAVLHTEQLQLLLKTCLLIRRLDLESRIRIITYRLAILNSLLASLGLVRRQIHNDTAHRRLLLGRSVLDKRIVVCLVLIFNN